MKEAKENRSVSGGFVGKYIILAIIIGGCSFLLENLIPQLCHWELNSTFAIFQSVMFIISTLLAIIIAANFSFKKVTYATTEEAKEAVKPIKTLIIFVGLLVLLFNLVYFYGIEKSQFKNIDEKYKEYENVGQVVDVVDGEAVTENMVRDENGGYELPESKMNEKIAEQKYDKMFLNVYLSSKEIMTILVYAYAVQYVEKMIYTRVDNKSRRRK